MRWAAVFVLAVGCMATHRAPRDRTAESNLACAADPSRSTRPEVPTLERCLGEPWTKVTSSLTHVVCGERAHSFRHEGKREATDAEKMALLESHRKEIHAIKGVESSGFGVCCDNGPPGGCLRVGIGLCTVSLDELAAKFEGWVNDSGLADANVNMLVELQGCTGPRCTGVGKPCGPEVYSHETLAKAGYRCDAPRIQLQTARTLSWGTCAHDGECVAAGCGNQCVPWTSGHMIGTCEGYLEMESAPAYCGCVTGSCAWFVQK
ncbi:MAG: hypothetical protein ACXWP4_08035 [Polyangiales bacterium]